MYSGERKGRGKASPTVIDQDLLSHKVPTLQRFTNVFQTICCITQQESYRMVGGHWVGCIIGRQFRQLALPQARKQKTPPSLTSQESFLSVFPNLIAKKQTPPLFLGSLLSIIAIIEVHLLQNLYRFIKNPKMLQL